MTLRLAERRLPGNFPPSAGSSSQSQCRPRFDQDCHGSCLKTRCTTLVPMPSFLPILRMPSPSALNSSIHASTEGLTVAGGAEGERRRAEAAGQPENAKLSDA
jgi:hypothetical protein